MTRLVVAPPSEQEHVGIHHPGAHRTFSRRAYYLSCILNRARPLAGVVFFGQSYQSRDLAAVDGAIGALERRGLGAVAGRVDVREANLTKG